MLATQRSTSDGAADHALLGVVTRMEGIGSIFTLYASGA